MRKQFNLQDWLKDKSQKVETRDGRIVHDIWPVKEPLFVHGEKTEVCALIDGEENMLVFFGGGKYLPVDSENPFDLFIVTPEEELTEWQRFISACLQKHGLLDCGASDRIAKESAAELLALARKQLIEELESRERNAFYRGLKNGKEQGKAEALRTRATELTENLIKSGLDKDSTPYNLIEFMCNLYDSKNWKEIEETAGLYDTRIKAAALKDLPRWESNLKSSMVDKADVIGQWLYYKEHRIRISDLEKLPGFKED